VAFVRIPPESLPENQLTIDEEGYQVVLEPDPRAAAIYENSDRTFSLAPQDLRSPVSFDRADPLADLPARRVLELAGARLLLHATIWQVDAAKLVEGLPPDSRSFNLRRVFLGFPKPSEQPDPMPSATVRVAGKVEYPNDREPAFIEETLGTFSAGTVLRRIGSAVGKLEVTVWCGDKELRYAIEAAIEDQFLAERDEERASGRRVLLPEYYNRTCRLRLLDIDDLTGPDEARKGRWIIAATVQAEIDRVILVQAPPDFDPRFEVEDSQ
jgi:virulence-associated protein VagC